MICRRALKCGNIYQMVLLRYTSRFVDVVLDDLLQGASKTQRRTSLLCEHANTNPENIFIYTLRGIFTALSRATCRMGAGDGNGINSVAPEWCACVAARSIFRHATAQGAVCQMGGVEGVCILRFTPSAEHLAYLHVPISCVMISI